MPRLNSSIDWRNALLTTRHLMQVDLKQHYDNADF